MTERTQGTLTRASKGPLAPPPALGGELARVAEAVSGWQNVSATAHWALYNPKTMDGIDFYVGEEELGHIHLDGSIHLATNPSLGSRLVADGLAQRFPYAEGWVQASIGRIGSVAAIALFKRNYERFVAT